MTRVKIDEFNPVSCKEILSNSEIDGYVGRFGTCSGDTSHVVTEKYTTGGLIKKPAWFEQNDDIVDDFLKTIKPPSKEAVKLSGVLRVKENEKSVNIDVVNHPPHYTRGKIEAIEVIDDFFKDNYYLGTIFKYLARAGYKDSELQDLKKAQWYINKYIELLEKK